MFDVGGGELILIVLAIIVLFGPKKIPEIAQMVGIGMRQFRAAQKEFTEQINTVKQEVNAQISDIDSSTKIDTNIKSETKPEENEKTEFSAPENSVKLPNNFKPITTNLHDDNGINLN